MVRSFSASTFFQYKRSGLSTRKWNLAATHWNSFNSSPVSRSSSSLASSGGSCHFAVLRSSLIWLALGPPTSSVPRVATPSVSIGQSQSLQGEEDMLLGLVRTRFPIVAMSVFYPRNSLFDTVTTPRPRVTTLLNLCAPRNKLSACLRSSSRPTVKNHHHAPECRFASLFGRSGTETPLRVFIPNKSLSVTVWNISGKPVHDIHHCWLVPAFCGVRMCVKKIPSRTCVS